MANKLDTETRALLDAICAWVVDDLAFMPIAAAKLRERFEAATTSRGLFQRDKLCNQEVKNRTRSR